MTVNTLTLAHYKDEELVCHCKDGNWYPAKILESEIDESGDMTYLVHYKGWSKARDEWVGENLLKLKCPSPSPVKTKPSPRKRNKEQPKKMTPAPAPAVKQQRGSNRVKSPKVVESPRKVKKCVLVIPRVLQKWLDKDWDMTHDEDPPRDVKLPATLTVRDILTQYEECVVDSSPDRANEMKEIADMYVQMFEKVLPARLLLPSERERLEQLEKEREEPVPTSQMFGGPHLLRMLNVYGAELENISDANVHPVKAVLENLLEFLVLEEKQIFNVDDNYL